MPVLKLIWLVWTLVLSGACANALPGPAASRSHVAAVLGVAQESITYDASNQADVAYDDRSKRISSYDEASVLVGDEKGNRPAREFTHFVKSVAAKSGFNRNTILEGFQDHHIISDKNPLTRNHELLDLSKLDNQSRANKIFLPTDAALHPTRSIHLGRHSTSVSRNLARQMDEVVDFGRQNGWTQQQYDQALRAIIEQERQLLRSGERALNRNARPWAQ